MFPDLTRDDVFMLETARLWLRWPRLGDREAMLRLAGEREVAEMTAQIPHPYPSQAADRYVFQARKDNATGEALHLAVTRKGRDELIGMVTLGPAPLGELCLGYWLGRPHWGKGLCTEAALAMVEAGFMITDAPAIVASARVLNAGSRRILDKLGFSHTGSRLAAFPARGGAMAVDQFVLERRDWAEGHVPFRHVVHAPAVGEPVLPPVPGSAETGRLCA